MQITVPRWAAETAPQPSTATDPSHQDVHPHLSQPERQRAGWRQLVFGPDTDPRWARPALIALLLITLASYTYNLTASGWANSFYSAAVQAGSQSWKAFFFGSSDAANSITVDKTPASLWVMALSVRAFGLSSFSILFPQVLMGVATVGILYAAVKRHFGAGAGLIAGAAMAITPVAVLMFRFNNPDALLVLLMTGAAALTLRAIENGRGRLLALAGVLLGLGFLTKMMQVFLVLPAFAAAYLLAANTNLGKRVLHGLGAVAALVLSAGWWIAIVELMPASMRPYIGGSQNNSILELTLGYNGLGRLNGNETGSVGGGMGWGQAGISRMFNSQIAGQISWFLPAALLLLVAGLILAGRAPRTDAKRAAYIVWGGWLLVTGITFSFMAGIFHEYYTVALAPAIAALLGMGLAQAWQRRGSLGGSILLAAPLTVTAAWSFAVLGQSSAYPATLRWFILIVGLTVSAAMVFAWQLPKFVVSVLVSFGLLAGVAGPAAYSITTLTTPHTGSIVTAGPNTRGGPGGAAPRFGVPPGTAAGTTGQNGPMGAAPNQGGTTAGRGGGMAGGMGGLLNASTPSAAVINTVSANSSEFTWVAAAVGSQNAAGMQLATQLPVMSVGGFNGSDPSPTVAEFKQLVAQGKIHYFIGGMGMGGGPGGGQNSGSNSSSEIANWVQAKFKTVTVDGTTLYDLTQPTGSN